MFIKTLYPNTKIHVRRKKVETLMTYTNELEVEVDFSDVDPSLLEESEDDTDSTVATLSTSDDNSDQSNSEINSTDTNESDPQDGDFGSVMNQNLQLVEEQLDSLEKRLNKRNNLFKTCGS
jgi:hypothetical protein